MDTNKIREVQALIDEARHRGHNIPQLVEAARLLQVELNAAPKVLTDEEPYRVEKSSGVYVIVGPNGRWPFHFHDEKLAHIRARDFNRVHKIARDNYGIGAPPQGLTVEEIERANNVKDQCIATAWDGLSGKILVDDGTGTMRELLCDAHDVIRLLLNKR